MKLFLSFVLILSTIHMITPSAFAADRFFDVQAIDTMKTSRDKARSGVTDEVIEMQIKAIAEAGATHVAIGTPYDSEFIPYMKRWVDVARKHHLKVWFRGNTAGWEGWFDYNKIDRDEHKKIVREFILGNPSLFEDGDVFVSCPECENGGPGDPRQTGDVEGFRTFIKEEYYLSTRAFKRIGKKNIITNYYSMNGDVAQLVMDRDMTIKLGGVMTVDHYVKTPEQLLSDVDKYAEGSGGKIVLGEWGAPIPDIHGDMTEGEQAIWLEDSLNKIIQDKNIISVNYWTFTDSSTQLWKENGEPKQGALVLKKYFKPIVVHGTVNDDKGKPLDNVVIESSNRITASDKGSFTLPLAGSDLINLTKTGYVSQSVRIHTDNQQELNTTIALIKKNVSFLEWLMDKLHYLYK